MRYDKNGSNFYVELRSWGKLEIHLDFYSKRISGWKHQAMEVGAFREILSSELKLIFTKFSIFEFLLKRLFLIPQCYFYLFWFVKKIKLKKQFTIGLLKR